MRTLIASASVKDGVVPRLKRLLAGCSVFDEPDLVSFDDVDKTGADKADLVIVNLCESPGQGQDVIRRLRERSQAQVLAVGEISDPKLILRAQQMGAHLFLDAAELDAEFQSVMSRVLRGVAGGDAAGKLTAVLSASGGCGASTLAVNLAALRGREYGRCALVDLNLCRGDLPALLDLKPQYSVADVCRNTARLDEAMMNKMLVHHSSGIHLLSSPKEFTDARAVTPTGVKAALSLARKLFPETVVDLEDCFHDEQVEALRQATVVLVVCRLEFTSLRNTRRLLDHLAKMDIQRARIKLVANQHGQAGELPVEEAEDALGGKIAAMIPHDPKVFGAGNNTGVPAVLADPNARAVKAIMDLANAHDAERNQPPGIVRTIRHLLKEVFHTTLR